MSHLIQAQFKLPADLVEGVEACLVEQGYTLYSNEEKVTAFVPTEKQDEFLTFMGNLMGTLSASMPEVTFVEMESRDWLAEQDEALPPVQTGRFYICRSNPPKESEWIVLQIEAATAFGSGHHETTRSCLLALSRLAEEKKISKALDVGCGSGILSLAISSLWGCPVVASDIDEESVTLTQKNIEINGFKQITALQSDGADHPKIKEEGPYTLIIANMHLNVLYELASAFSELLAYDGRLLLSGILKEQVDTLAKAYEPLGLKIEKIYYDGPWRTLTLEREHVASSD